MNPKRRSPLKAHTLALYLALALTLTACTTNNDQTTTTATDADGNPTNPTDPDNDPDNQNPATTTPAPPPPEELAAIVDILPLTPNEQDCLANAIGPDLTNSLGDNFDKDTEQGQAILALAQTCIVDNTTASMFVDATQTASGGTLTNQQLDCLTAGFRDLTDTQIESMLTGAIDPGNADLGVVTRINELYNDCDISL